MQLLGFIIYVTSAFCSCAGELLAYDNGHLYIHEQHYGMTEIDNFAGFSASPFVFREMMKPEKISSMVALTANLILDIIVNLLIFEILAKTKAYGSALTYLRKRKKRQTLKAVKMRKRLALRGN